MNDPRWYEALLLIEGRRLNRRRFMQTATAAGIAAGAGPIAGRRRSVSAQIDSNTLVIADNLKDNWISLDPGWFYEINPGMAMNLVNEALYDLPDSSKPTEFVPLLAADFPTVSEDGLSATVPLRQGVKFHTGNELTADDLVFSWNRLANIKFQASFMATDYWDSVEKVDDYTIKLNFSAPNAALVPILSSMPLSVIDSKVAQEHGATDAEDADQVDTFKDWMNEGNSAGSGPFKLVQWDIDGEVVLEKNPDYWGEPAKIDRIIFRNIVEPNAQLQAVEAGEADIAYSIDPDNVEAVKSNSALQVISGPTLAHEYLALNNNPEVGGPLANKAMRQALGYAIDYDGIIGDLMKGGAIQPATVAPEPLLGTQAVSELRYVTDLAKAQALFDEVSGGQPVELTFSYGAGASGEGGLDLETLATKLQSDFQQINGLTVKLNPMDPAQRLQDYREGKLQMTVSGWTPDYPDIHTYAEPFGKTGTAAAKRVGYSNPKVDELLASGIAEQDPVKREQMYIDILTMLIDDAAFLVLYQPVDQKPAAASVKDAQTHSVYMMYLRNAHKE